MNLRAFGRCIDIFRRNGQSSELTTADDDTQLLSKQATRFSFQNSKDVITKEYPPEVQKALLLYGPKQEYILVKDAAIPQVQNDSEMLLRVLVVGLNPIDWKAP